MAQRDVREGGYCVYWPDEDFRAPIRLGNQVFIYGWPMPGACFDTFDETVAWLAAAPPRLFWDMAWGPVDTSPEWLLYNQMECVIDPTATVRRLVPVNPRRWNRQGPIPKLGLHMGHGGWVGQVVECRQLRPGEREQMGVERRRAGREHLRAMRGVSKIMDMAPTVTIPPAVTNKDW
jgi:hypothetical protein